jgi:UBX domain-containing protein 1/4
LAELKAKMAEKRAKKNVEEEQERKANEDLRRKAGKVRIIVPSNNILSCCHQDSTKIKQDLQLKEAMKETEQRKRGKGTAETRLLILNELQIRSRMRKLALR